MNTGRSVLRALLRADVRIEARGQNLVLKPADRVTLELCELVRGVKPEMLHVLSGDFTRAAHSLLMREIPSAERREAFGLRFDERVAMAHVGDGVEYGDACRIAYRSLCDELEAEARTGKGVS